MTWTDSEPFPYLLAFSPYLPFSLSTSLPHFFICAQGEVLIVSRHATCIQVNRCSVEIKDMTIAVEEGALAHHPLQCDHADVEMESVECYGGLYAAFAFDVSNITANRCRFHNSYSHGFHLMNSTGFFQNCFFFKNLECGINISGHQSNVRFFRCRSAHHPES